MRHLFLAWKQPGATTDILATYNACRSNLPRNTWLIFEPAFLEEHPGLKGVKKDMKGQVAAIVSTNQDWMIQIVKPMLPGVCQLFSPTEVLTSLTQ